MRWTPALLLLIVACGRPAERAEALSEALPQAPKSATIALRAPNDHQAWLELYDQGGFPDVTALRRVEFESGRSPGQGDEQPTVHYERAWVLSTTPLVLLRDSLRMYQPEGVVVPEHMREPACESQPREPFSYKEVDFADELRAELEAIENLADPREGWRDTFGMAGELEPWTTYWLVRARWAQMRGLPDLSRRALAQVERWDAIQCEDSVCNTTNVIRTSLAAKLLWQVTDGLRDFTPRPQVRELLVRALALEPDAPNATELLARLDRTIATDTDDPSWPEADDPDRVERLIYLLREQKRDQFAGLPGRCGHDGATSPIRDPAAELTALGRAAIPALIEHLDDDTVTRSFAYARRFAIPKPLSVGDLALRIIEQIAGRSFPEPEQQRVREWWAGASERTQREQLLRDLHSAEGDDLNRLASKLLDEYGVEVWPELTRAFAETRNANARVDLLNAMDYGLPTGPEARELIERFLVDALEDRSRSVRLSAAKALSDRGRHDGTEIIIRDLDQYWLEPGAWAHFNAYEYYFSVLLADGSAAAVDAINRAIRHRGYVALEALTNAVCRRRGECERTLDSAAKARLLDTIADFLDELGDPGGIWNGGPNRVRDRAAVAYLTLTGRDTSALAALPSSIERDRMILDLLNEHRAQRGQGPVSWPHLAPLRGTPGRDHVQRVHLLRAHVHEAVAREWLAGFADRDLSLQEITTALVELAQRHPDVGFTLWIHRFPADAGVMLTLQVAAPSRSPGQLVYGVSCYGGADCSSGSTSIASVERSEPASGVFAQALDDKLDGLWNRAPTRIEDYVFHVKVSPDEPSGFAALGGRCSVGEDFDVGWLLVLAGLFPLGLSARTESRRRR